MKRVVSSRNEETNTVKTQTSPYKLRRDRQVCLPPSEVQAAEQ